MEGRTDVEAAPQAPKAPQSESAVDAPAIRNAQSKLQSAIEKRPFEDFERIPSANYQELARTFITISSLYAANEWLKRHPN